MQSVSLEYNSSTFSGGDELYYVHFHEIANYSQYNITNGTNTNLSQLNFDVDDENPYGLRYGMLMTVVLRYVQCHLFNPISVITIVYCGNKNRRNMESHGRLCVCFFFLVSFSYIFLLIVSFLNIVWRTVLLALLESLAIWRCLLLSPGPHRCEL